MLSLRLQGRVPRRNFIVTTGFSCKQMHIVFVEVQMHYIYHMYNVILQESTSCDYVLYEEDVRRKTTLYQVCVIDLYIPV